MFAGKSNRCCSVIIRNGGFLPFRSPSSLDGIWQHTKRRNRLKPVTACRKITAANEVESETIEIVAIEITDQNSCGAGSHKAVERLIEECRRSGNADLVREIAADRAAAGRGVIRFADAREQEQARIVESPGGQKDKRSGLEDFLPRRINVGHASSGRFRRRFKKYASDPSAGSQGDIFAPLNNGQQEIRRLRLCAHHAAKAPAESAIRAPTSRNTVRIRVGLADVRGGSGVGVIPQRLGGVAE